MKTVKIGGGVTEKMSILTKTGPQARVQLPFFKGPINPA